uniref:Secreted protein n=1 Tax=Anopheles dirus TaxID=7168 RepID=A0A182NX50_9DIPT
MDGGGAMLVVALLCCSDGECGAGVVCPFDPERCPDDGGWHVGVARSRLICSSSDDGGRVVGLVWSWFVWECSGDSIWGVGVV